MSELLDRAREAMSVCICHGDNDDPDIEIRMSLVTELIAEIEQLEAERDQALRTLDKVTESWKRLVAGASDD